MIRLAAAASLAALALAAPAAAAHTAGSGTVLKLKTAPGMSLKFAVTSLSAKAGKVTLVLTNVGLMPHNIALKGKGVSVLGKIVPHGKTSTVTTTLKPGSYEFYCSVPGHEQAGMKGTLTVK